MPLVSGQIGMTGPTIDLMVGVSSHRAKLLRSRSIQVPKPYGLRVLIDTGATVSGFSSDVFAELGLQPVSRQGVYTSATTRNELHQANFFDVAIYLVAEGSPVHFGDLRAMAADCWMPGEGIQGLIGWDILNRCHFECHGPSRAFTLAF